MKTLKELLNDADPVRQEPEIASERIEASRQAVLAAAATSKDEPAPRLRYRRLAAAGVTGFGILVVALFLWASGGSHTYASVRFEIRLAEEQPGAGLQEMTIAGDDRPVYVHEEVVVDNSDVTRAQVRRGWTSGFVVSVNFAPQGAAKMREATGNNIGKRLAILIDDEVVMAPKIRDVIGEAAEINGNYTREQAERIVRGIH